MINISVIKNSIHLIISFLFFFTSNLFPQDDVFKWDTICKDVIEKYQVIKDDTLLRHGAYEYYYKDNLMKEGFFENGMKSGNWTLYYEKGYYSKGKYYNDEKQGTWVLMKHKDTIVEIQYVNNEVIELYSNIEKKKKGIKKEEEKEEYIMVENMPSFEGGDMSNFNSYVTSNIVYPPLAKALKVKGKIHIEFQVNEVGEIENINVIQDLHPFINREAVKIIRHSPPWFPGFHEGFPVKVKFIYPMVFIL